MKYEIDKSQSDAVSSIFKTLGHSKRLLILCALSDKTCGVQELAEKCDLSQSQLSQFLKLMVAEGYLSFTKEGRNVYYKIEKKEIKQLIKASIKIFCDP